nr:hypothetical protein [uncultured Lachnoclostridium sp.]
MACIGYENLIRKEMSINDKQKYCLSFQTAVNYEELMNMKRKLIK